MRIKLREEIVIFFFFFSFELLDNTTTNENPITQGNNTTKFTIDDKITLLIGSIIIT